MSYKHQTTRISLSTNQLDSKFYIKYDLFNLNLKYTTDALIPSQYITGVTTDQHELFHEPHA